MNDTVAADFAGLLLENLGGFCLFLVLGLVAGTAFPLALLARRSLARSGAWLDAGARLRRGIFYVLLIAACAAIPWAALWIGRWHDGHAIGAAHACVLIASSAATMAQLLRRWRLRGD